jgi:hypothetical protein
VDGDKYNTRLELMEIPIMSALAKYMFESYAQSPAFLPSQPRRDDHLLEEKLGETLRGITLHLEHLGVVKVRTAWTIDA